MLLKLEQSFKKRINKGLESCLLKVAMMLPPPPCFTVALSGPGEEQKMELL